MIDLALQDKDRFVSVQEISLRQGISEKYLEAILGILGRAGFLISQRGKGGGYKLARSPEQYTAGAILKLTEGSLSVVSCLEEGGECPRADNCRTIDFWRGLNKAIDDYVESVKLSDLLDVKLDFSI
jgi:Rrf2 family protein